ncbi:BAG family molecular chaperone regulator 6-like, partial [Trifolium medium]|nr:BAG family molecular chaperone regulator 6-like [Trifolium medium]
MIPAYRNRSLPYPHYYDLAMELVPLQMNKSPFPYEQPWPSVGHYGQATLYHYISAMSTT